MAATRSANGRAASPALPLKVKPSVSAAATGKQRRAVVPHSQASITQPLCALRMPWIFAVYSPSLPERSIAAPSALMAPTVAAISAERVVKEREERPSESAAAMRKRCTSDLALMARILPQSGVFSSFTSMVLSFLFACFRIKVRRRSGGAFLSFPHAGSRIRRRASG